jgi:hypothetical protein
VQVIKPAMSDNLAERKRSEVQFLTGSLTLQTMSQIDSLMSSKVLMNQLEDRCLPQIFFELSYYHFSLDAVVIIHIMFDYFTLTKFVTELSQSYLDKINRTMLQSGTTVILLHTKIHVEAI